MEVMRWWMSDEVAAVNSIDENPQFPKN